MDSKGAKDDWDSGGIQEAANLLFNISDAVAFLHSQDYVHGDIKPDNIGKEDDNYILLDFGICRRTSEFTKDTQPGAYAQERRSYSSTTRTLTRRRSMFGPLAQQFITRLSAAFR